jgi:hypothetical protein
MVQCMPPKPCPMWSVAWHLCAVEVLLEVEYSLAQCVRLKLGSKGMRFGTVCACEALLGMVCCLAQCVRLKLGLKGFSAWHSVCV